MPDYADPDRYTEEQYRTLIVARQLGARDATRNLQEHVAVIAARLGDAWLSDPRRPGMQEALSVLASRVSDVHLDEDNLAKVDALTAMSDDLDKRPASPFKIPLRQS